MSETKFIQNLSANGFNFVHNEQYIPLFNWLRVRFIVFFTILLYAVIDQICSYLRNRSAYSSRSQTNVNGSSQNSDTTSSSSSSSTTSSSSSDSPPTPPPIKQTIIQQSPSGRYTPKYVMRSPCKNDIVHLPLSLPHPIVSFTTEIG